MDNDNRVIVLIDMDCFYCQVEEKLNPELKGKPIAVVQYNPWKGGGIIAVNYEARAQGVTRHMRGDEAKEKCPEIQLPSVPCERGKANISKYRDAGIEVAKVLQKFSPLLERASIDEAYLDITAPVQQRLKSLNPNNITTNMMPNTFALGYDSINDFVSDVQNYGSEYIDFDQDNARMLLVGAVIVSEIRAAVYEETGYRCSAGIAHNKILAKLVCGMNKPNKQTVLPKHSVNILYKTLGVKKVKHLGGKFGDAVCEILKISKMAELQKFTEKQLQSKFDEKNGMWLYNIARGIDLEPVQAKFNPKSIGCCKQFKGKSALVDLESLHKWLKDLGDEIEDRLEKDALETNRTPKQMVASFSHQLPDGRDTSSSRSYNFVPEDELCADLFTSKALELVLDGVEGVRPKDGEPNRKLLMPVKFLGISVGKFEDNSESKKTRKIIDFFSTGTSKETSKSDYSKPVEDKDAPKLNKKVDKEFILQKFFQGTTKEKENVKNEPITMKTEKKATELKGNVVLESSNTMKTEKNPFAVQRNVAFESTLDKQESFFARFLKKGQSESSKTVLNVIENVKSVQSENIRSTTPICQVVECGDNSNDTDQSSSTINNEINKSLVLFEEDPQDVARVSNMRTLLNSTKEEIIKQDDTHPEGEIKPSPKPEDPKEGPSKTPSPHKIETVECSECRKPVPIHLFDTHADYHLALKLREEERLIIRKEREKAKKSQNHVVKKAEMKVEPKIEANTSIASFFVKLDETIPTECCAECGKKISIEKYAEHLDFHEAQKLSRQLNKKPVLNLSSNSMKRKRKSISPVKKPKMVCKSIDSFFTTR